MLSDLAQALAFAREVKAEQDIIESLLKSIDIISISETYYDRLPADQELCRVLNNLLGELIE